MTSKRPEDATLERVRTFFMRRSWMRPAAPVWGPLRARTFGDLDDATAIGLVWYMEGYLQEPMVDPSHYEQWMADRAAAAERREAVWQVVARRAVEVAAS